MDATLRDEVFGGLPVGLARTLDELGATQVLQTLVTRGWSPAQLAARVAVLPTSVGGAGQVLGFLQALLGEETAVERTGREQRAQRQSEEVARALAPTGTAADVAVGVAGDVAVVRAAAARCALCTRVADFVTERVQLCDRCVRVLQTGKARLQTTA